MARLTAKDLHGAIQENVCPPARIITDDYRAYNGIGASFAGGHHTVNHSAKEYVRGDIHTNTIEGFFSLLKRGVYGTFHSVSKQHLDRYVAKFQNRYNTRKMEDGERTVLAIQKADGKRLLYKEPVQRVQQLT